MADPWTEALEEAYASAPVDEYVIRTLELIHPVFVDEEENADSIRVALDDRDWHLELEAGHPLFPGETKLFEALALEVKLPEQTERTMGTLDLGLDNVPKTVIEQLQLAVKIRASAALIYREWRATRNTETGVYSVSGPPDMIIDQLTVKVVTATRLRLDATATFLDLLNRAFPRRKFTRDDFPGLFGSNAQ